MSEEWRETPDERRARLLLANHLSALWRCRFTEMPEGVSFHFQGIDVPVIMQIKISTPTMDFIDRDGGVYRSIPQWNKNRNIVISYPTTLYYVLVVSTADGTWTMATRSFEDDGVRDVRPRGREGPDNDSSNVKSIMLKKHRFTKVTREPPWQGLAQGTLF